MATDTRSKRFSMMNLGEADQVLFEADGAVDADDRAHLLGLYGGIALAGASPGFTAGSASPDAIGRALWQRPCLWFLIALLFV